MTSLITYKTDIVANYLDSTETHDDFQFHCHNIYEIFFFLEGDADIFVEGLQYHLTPNSILFFAPQSIHGIRVNSPKHYKRFTIHFNAELLSIERRSFLLSPFKDDKKAKTHEIYYQDVNDFNLYPFFESLIDCKKLPFNLAEKLIPIHLEALLSRLVLMYKTVNRAQNSITLSNTVLEVTNYINQNLSEQITIESLCERFYISKVHLNRLFHNSIGTTVFGYITCKRISYAQHLLEAGLPATEVAVKVGYNDYSTFYRAYKKFTGHSPKEETED